MPERSRREGHLVRKDRAFVEDAIAIRVFHPADEIGQLFEQSLLIEIESGILTKIQPPTIVERPLHGILHQRRPSRERHFIAIWHRELG